MMISAEILMGFFFGFSLATLMFFVLIRKVNQKYNHIIESDRKHFEELKKTLDDIKELS